VIVRDANANPVSGVSVTFAVASGSGSITGGSQTTNSSGIATVGSWTLGTGGGGERVDRHLNGSQRQPDHLHRHGRGGRTECRAVARGRDPDDDHRVER